MIGRKVNRIPMQPSGGQYVHRGLRSHSRIPCLNRGGDLVKSVGFQSSKAATAADDRTAFTAIRRTATTERAWLQFIAHRFSIGSGGDCGAGINISPTTKG